MSFKVEIFTKVRNGTEQGRKEKLLLDPYYNKGYTYRQITTELKMSPNQIRDIIRRHEEKDNAIASRKRELSLSSKAYNLYSKGKNSKWR
jgi:transposase